MVKRGKNQKQKHWSSVNSKLNKDEHVHFDSDDLDDEIDAFHKKRDMIPLDIHEDSRDSDEDDQQPVFDYKGIDGDDFYNSYKQQRDLKLRMKAQKFSRNPQDVLEADTTVDGKRNITAPMLKNRGLTRNRKKQNPRGVNRLKYEKAKKRRQGQVREIRKQTGPYEWEKTGINPWVSKSIRIKG